MCSHHVIAWPAAPYALDHSYQLLWLIPATLASSAVASGTPRPGLPSASFRLFAVLQKRACFSVRAEKGKTVLCRSADKSLPLVTHCLTNAHSYFLKTPTAVWPVARLQARISGFRGLERSCHPSLLRWSGFIYLSGAACGLIKWLR